MNSSSQSSKFDPHKRPRPGETIDDLIKLQSSFTEARKGNARPAATAVRIGNGDVAENSRTFHNTEEDEIRANVPGESCFTGSIVEKYVTPQLQPSKPPQEKRKSKFSLLKAAGPHPKPQFQPPSVYSSFETSQFSYNSSSHSKEESPSMPNTKPLQCEINVPNASVGDKIHPLLAGYTEADILNARDALLSSMHPDTKKILLKRSFAAREGKARPTVDDSTTSFDGTSQTVEKFSSLTSVELPKIDIVETEKLEWTGSVCSKKSSLPNSSNNPTDEGNSPPSYQKYRSGRFGLDGRLVTEDLDFDPTTWDRGLHHHGEEMERAGYTLEELFTLSRSTFPHQRTFGYDVMAKIFKRAHDGEFDQSLDISIFEACNELDFVHVLRTGVDFWDSLSLNASINCLSALIFPDQEEICLDIAFNWPNATPFPWLSTSVEKSVTSETQEEITDRDLKDFQYVKNDLIGFLIDRTDILARFNYILKEGMDLLKEPGVDGMLKVLIRVARHSPNSLLQCKELLGSIMQYYMGPNWLQIDSRPANMSGIPLPPAIKVFRILASSSLENAQKLFNEFNPFPSIMSYLAFKEWGSQSLVKKVGALVLEASSLWEVFLSYGIGIEEYMSFFPVTMASFQSLLSRDRLPSFDLAYSARLQSLLGKALSHSEHQQMSYSVFKESIGCVASFISKILAMLGRDETVSHLDQDMCLLAVLKGLECLTLAQKYEAFPVVDKEILKFVACEAYGRTTKCLTNHSYLLLYTQNSEIKLKSEKRRYPENISTCNAILMGGFQTPIMDKGSPFAFLTCLLRYSKHLFKSDDTIRRLVLNDNCKSYLDQIGSKKFSTCPNFFLRFELYCIRELINLMPASDRLLPTSKIMPFVEIGDELLAEDLLQMTISGTNVPNPEELTKFYKTFLFISSPELNQHNFKRLNSRVVPHHWILEPLNILYASLGNECSRKKQPPEAFSVMIINSVQTTLEFIVFCLRNCDFILINSSSSIPALYTRLALIFMMENQLFLEPKIRSLLKDVLLQLLSNRIWNKCKNMPIFSKFNGAEEFPFTFTSFYSDFVETFGATSFADDVFASFLMLPLRTAEDAAIKSVFWNEQTLQFLRMGVEQSLIPLDHFTTSPETDANIRQIYIKAISSKRITHERNPFLFAVASYHVSARDRHKTN